MLSSTPFFAKKNFLCIFVVMKLFDLASDFSPTGDQPQAIAKLVEGLEQGAPAQTLLGVTGSGKTFTIANVIAQVNRPTLILSHNKTLAAQLYGEFKKFFPENAVEYYVSYYDYYQPEAYIAHTDTYIEKDLAINEEIDKLRLAAVSSLLSGRRDVIVVSSVSCIYGMGNPNSFYNNVIELRVGEELDRNVLLRRLVDCLYSRNDITPTPGDFRVKGDTVDVFLAYSNDMLRISFWGDEIERIEEVDAANGKSIGSFEYYKIYPANLFLTDKETAEHALKQIKEDLAERTLELECLGKPLEAKRLYERTNYDMEMIRELGHCTGIENYSRYFDGRAAGTRPYCLLDFFPKDFLMVIDESHVTVPQIGAMYGGDRSRKEALVEHGFRLPAAMDNRPLRFEEFQSMLHQTIYISATPANYELAASEGVVVEQVIRPTGLLDPIIEVRPSLNQMDDLMEEILKRREADERVLITALTKRMAEELATYLTDHGINTSYIHSDVDTIERVQIMDDLRRGIYTVLVGVNLLREGLDLPEVSLVAILDADKEGFLRSHRSLTQTVGRAARNVNGLAIMYADKITDSMQQTIDETNRRRRIQQSYNTTHGITPTPIRKALGTGLTNSPSTGEPQEDSRLFHYALDEAPIRRVAQEEAVYQIQTSAALTAENTETTTDIKQLMKQLEHLRKKMEQAAKQFDFVEAAQYRDEMLHLDKLIKSLTT